MKQVKIETPYLKGIENIDIDVWNEETLRENKYMIVPLKVVETIDSNSVKYIDSYDEIIFKLENKNIEPIYMFFKLKRDLTREDWIDILYDWPIKDIDKYLLGVKTEEK